MILFKLSAVVVRSSLSSSSNRLSSSSSSSSRRNNILLLRYYHQFTCFHSSSYLSDRDRGGEGRSPSLSNHPNVASVLSLRPSPPPPPSDSSPSNTDSDGVGVDVDVDVVARSSSSSSSSAQPPPSLILQRGGGTQPVTVAGFVRTIRNQKQRSFVELGDGSTIYPLQAVLSPSHAKGYVSLFLFFFLGNAT